MVKRERYGLLHAYVGREYVLSFLVAFLFFFFIFFVNQILVLAQKILLKNVRIMDVLVLVVLSIPQFLMYTMPFSSLASASMVIGNLSSQNEILALRSCGIHVKHIFLPILFISLFFSAGTLMIADRMIPYTTERYKELYAQMLQSVPTLELDSYSSTQFNDIVISNGLVQGNVIHDVVIFDNSDVASSRVISASEGSLTVLDIDRFLYRLDLVNPELLVTDASSLTSYSYAKAGAMSLYLDLSSSAGGYVSITPSQMSLTQLKEASSNLVDEQTYIDNMKQRNISDAASRVGESLYALEKGSLTAIGNAINGANNLKAIRGSRGFSFYYQYYRSEYQKKIALSFACTILVFVAFPISFFRVRNGRLIGFGMSMLVAVFYWFFIYYMHVQAVESALHPAIFLWTPNAVVLLVGLFLLWRTRK
ncbi:MAG: LptF/LptG family permease [Sphaerochaetaceae bacterium]|nr:LptF/LptG family permease [Sphaerochaetaceae bacterium]